MIDVIFYGCPSVAAVLFVIVTTLPAILERRARARQNRELDAFADAYLERARLAPFEKWLRRR